MLKVAMLSYWHVHAWDYTRQVQERNDCQIVAVWDEVADRGQAAADKLGVPFYADLADLLANSGADAIVNDAPTNLHEEILIACAQAGKHIFTEKVMAITTASADRIIAAVQEADVKFMISLPRLTETKPLHAKKVLDSGLLGKVTLARIRLAHDGGITNWLPEHFFNKDQCGGGAMIDLGCHPMYMAAFYLGVPKSVTAQYGFFTGREVEDNAVALLSYDNGSIAIVEAGFASMHSPFAIELYGTEGTLLIGRDVQLRSNKLAEGDLVGWVEPDRLADPIRNPLNQWVDEILTGAAPTITIEQGRLLTQLMEAANLSALEGRTVVL